MKMTMAGTLGLHNAPAGISAVRLDAVGATGAVVIELGDSGPVAACLVARDDSGAVLVGDAARGVDGPTVSDPIERAVAGRIGALAAVINHVVGRTATATGTAPRRLAIVVADDLDRAGRDRVVEAGTAAGLVDTVAVPLSAASAQPPDVDPVVAIAAGAARVASLAAAPLVTREDLGEEITPKTVTVVPTEPTGSVSVFEPEEPGESAAVPPPVRPPPTPVASAPASAPPTQVVAAVSVPPEPQPLRYEPPSRRISAGAIAVAVLIGLIAAVAGALVLFDSGDDDTMVTDDLVETSSTTEPPTSTEAPTTTEGVPTTSDPDSPTTTDTTTSTTTTEPVATTTTPVAVAAPGDVTLSETGLRLVGGELVLFDQDADLVIVAVSGVLGEPDSDDAYEASTFCLGERSRFVSWGDLELVFTEDVLDSGVGRFTQWFAGSHNDPEGLVTLSGVGVSATVSFLEVTFGDALVLVEPIPGDPTGLFAATNPGSGAVLNGTTSARDPEGVVTSLWAGDSCTRIFT